MNTKNSKRNQNYRHRYGISAADVDRRITLQDGRCAICGKRRSLNVDHNHTTGELRAMVCHLCNLIVGHLENHPLLVQRAEAYLRSYEHDQ